jgi:hypothetical protein
MVYCFVQHKEDTCEFIDAENLKYKRFKPLNLDYFDFYYEANITMSDKKNFLFFTTKIEEAERLIITHDPDSDVTAEKFTSNNLFREGTTLFVNAIDFQKSKKNKFNVAILFNFSKPLDNLSIYYKNSHYKNKEFTEDLGKKVVTNYYKKTYTFTEFYFSLPVYNLTTEIVEFRYLIFRPENTNFDFQVREVEYDVKEIPKYGDLTLEDKSYLDVFYINIEDFKIGNKIYLKIFNSEKYDNYYMNYTFCNSNYPEDFSLNQTVSSENVKPIKDNGVSIFYFSIKILEERKYLLLKKNSFGTNFTIKHTKKNEYKNSNNSIKILMIIIVVILCIVIFGIIFYKFFYMKRKNIIKNDKETIIALGSINSHEK